VVFAARSAAVEEPVLNGWAAHGPGPDTVKVHHRAVSGPHGDEVEVETSMVEWNGKPTNVAGQLIGSDRTGRPSFPLSSTVTRETISMRVGGRHREIPLYRCGPRWIVTLRAAGRYVTVTGRTVDPAGVELVRLTESEVRASLRAAEKRHREFEASWRAEQGETPARSTRRRRQGVPTMVAEIDGPVFAALGPDLEPARWRGGGRSGGAPSRAMVESPGSNWWLTVRVTTMTGPWPYEEEMIARRLLDESVGPTVEFPFSAVVERGKLPMRIACRRRDVTVYVSRRGWLARTRTAGRWLWIEGRATDPRTIDIAPLTDAELAAAVARTDEAMRRARARQG
jgi:hypothetical protein